jgi:hypothetical protein
MSSNYRLSKPRVARNDGPKLPKPILIGEPTPDIPDDRRTCGECARFDGDYCRQDGSRPHPDVKRRCRWFRGKR